MNNISYSIDLRKMSPRVGEDYYLDIVGSVKVAEGQMLAHDLELSSIILTKAQVDLLEKGSSMFTGKVHKSQADEPKRPEEICGIEIIEKEVVDVNR